MKILLGIGRYLVDEHGTRQCQRSDDIWEVDVPDDGSEYLGRIWMVVDGFEVLNLPLTMGPAMTAIMNSKSSEEEGQAGQLARLTYAACCASLH